MAGIGDEESEMTPEELNRRMTEKPKPTCRRCQNAWRYPGQSNGWECKYKKGAVNPNMTACSLYEHNKGVA